MYKMFQNFELVLVRTEGLALMTIGSLELDFIFLFSTRPVQLMILRAFHLETSTLQSHLSQKVFHFPVSNTSVKTVQLVFLTLAVPALTAGL